MKRQESKFLLPLDILSSYLSELSKQYSLLAINKDYMFLYNSTYFDTSDMKFYNMHHNGAYSRYKVRVRHYLSTGARYLEVKKKDNKGVCTKSRRSLIAQTAIHSLDEWISNVCPVELSLLQPSINIQYQRMTLMSMVDKERVTIDLNVSFGSLRNFKSHQLTNNVIVEVKREKNTKDSLAYQLLRKRGFREVSLSKYCIGSGLTQTGNIKINRFKRILNRIKSMKHERVSGETRSDMDLNRDFSTEDNQEMLSTIYQGR
ncbi:polyphosphate polymerase domain-containing protein [Pleionea sediminis]|uniref:polyphosphate polymerase domain-containing protein n=1 Tax=Pleionea sediminis TaxID=2569479 RepID=UPI0013DE50A1|nr:polyphosphate polymerase domain-containing protein [Pleionea sediminis]